MVYIIMERWHDGGGSVVLEAFSTLEKAELGKKALEDTYDWNENCNYHYEIICLEVR